ncbi:hypothetical protein KC906_01690 [Candidatus Kaiserbacteria bacterium]|nr:hypothetical protein [Candidatus Kaiserbacteria bacterium]MCB9812296.1 hypothetical protein [Candidatus Nomurabacteria bacterium]
MKKILVGGTVGLLLFSIVFHRALITTYDFYNFQAKYPEVIDRGTVNWQTVRFSSDTQTHDSSHSLTLDRLTITLPFSAQFERAETYVHAYHDAQAVTLFAAVTPDFFAEHADDFTDHEQAGICALLSRTATVDACHNEQTLWDAYLRLKPDDVGFFSSSVEKGLFLKLMILKKTELLSNRIAHFETSNSTGYLYYLGGDNFAAHVFVDPGTMFSINFTGLNEAAVTTMLSTMLVE